MSTDVAEPIDRSAKELNRIEFWLQFCFAIVACLGGLVLSSGPGSQSIAILAVSFSVIGFVFVDRLRWIYLPSIGAYICMGMAAVFCVQNFWDLRTGDEKMNSVALLLVLVQAILMMQRKSPRIFEQLCVFCLLQMVVGAVFSDAVNFGLVFVPLVLIGAAALVVMSAVAASEGISTHRATHQLKQSARTRRGDQANASKSPALNWRKRLSQHWVFRPIRFESAKTPEIQTWSTQSAKSLAESASSLQRYAIASLAPAIVLVAAVFFYALPRTGPAVRLGHRGPALVGFSQTVRLEQFGQMLQSTAIALRINLVNRKTGKPYLPSEPIYLRGRVLENYSAVQATADLESADSNSRLERSSAEWTAVLAGPMSGRQKLPLEFIPTSLVDQQMFDAVDVDISAGAMQEPSLFAIAPYHANQYSTQVVHAVDRWTVARRGDTMKSYPPLEYGFGTNAFFNGEQSAVISRTSTLGRMIASTTNELANVDRLGEESQAVSQYDVQDELTEEVTDDVSAAARSRQYHPESSLSDLTHFDADRMPTVARRARDVMNSIPPSRRTTVAIAEAFQRHLSVAGGYTYTLNLDAPVQAGMDPIEQFMAKDRRGHCQYFASALAMMLRSVNIPARLVVGYRTAEYNDLGQYFVARQLHAHAWVEALVDRDQLDRNSRLFGQAPSGEYWLRLDPTPGDDVVSQFAGSNVDQVMDMAENLLDKYVVSMDSRRQNESLGMRNQRSWIASLFGWLPKISRMIQSPDWLMKLGGVFSWQSAAIGVALSFALFALNRLSVLPLPAFRLPVFRWFPMHLLKKSPSQADKTHVVFYADALQEIAKIGWQRSHDQTPLEFLETVTQRAHDWPDETLVNPLREVTSAFYQACYAGRGQFSERDAADVNVALEELRAGVRSVLSKQHSG